MSTLDSSSTITEVYAVYDDNASWEEDGSTTKAKAFVTACRFMLRHAEEASRGGDRTTVSQKFNYEAIRAGMMDAKKYIAEQAAGSSSNPNVLHPDWSRMDV